VHKANKLYVEYDSGEREFYDLKTDPYELDSQHATADPQILSELQGRLEALRNCAADSCRAAED
jgi:N-acetylglucosamine-6-sulfatase